MEKNFILTEQQKKITELSQLFKVPDLDGSGEKVPLILTYTQQLIWLALVTRGKAFNKSFFCVITPSQYGKSEIVSCALLLRIMSNPNEKWLLVAPSEPKAQIIMTKLRGHLFDQEDFVKMIPKTFSDVREKLQHERSQRRITLSNGSSIQIISADADNKSEGGQKLMGSGAANIVIDESCEVTDEIKSKIVRMLGATRAPFMMELGNPWERNHFYRSWIDPEYFPIFCDYNIALEEGRFTREHVEMMRKQPNFGVLMEGKFPEAGVMDSQGYAPVFSERIFELNSRKKQDVPYISGRKILGLDVSYKGKDSNVWVLRGDNAAELLYENHDANTMNTIAITIELARQYGVEDRDIFIDATGGGYIVYQAFLEKGYNINAVEFGTKPQDPAYKNVRAEGYFLLNQWLNNGGVLIDNPGWKQLQYIKYKNDLGRIKIMDKQDIIKTVGHSPDVADALMLTCIGGISNQRKQMESVSIKEQYQPTYN